MFQVKKFVQGLAEASEKTKEDMESKMKTQIKLMISNIGTQIKTRCVFVIIAIIENTTYSKNVRLNSNKKIDKKGYKKFA